MVKIDTNLYDYPVSITDEEFEEITGIHLLTELIKESGVKIWLESCHESVYNRIYQIGGKTFKDRLISEHIDTLKPVIIRSLCAQLQYMLDSNGDFGKTDGSSTNADGTLILTDNEQLRKKILAPKVVDILTSARPNLLYGE